MRKKLLPFATVLFSILASLAAPLGTAENARKDSRKHRPSPAQKGVARAPVPAEEDCSAQESPGNAGLRAFRDPRTGQLREPEPEELKALSENKAKELAARASVERLQAIVHANGMVSVDLQGAFESELIARKNSDGSISIRCVSDSQATAKPSVPLNAEPKTEEK